ncbi:MAG: putative O-glycosylation ligase, exosortase A system-associated [Gammaproteobacteria bacterium]
MRDLLILFMVVGSIPLIFMRPWIGIIMWCWLGFMNPHRLTWGFAYDFAFAQVIALVTLAAIVISKEKKRIDLTPLVIVWLAWILWMNITTYFALEPAETVKDYDRAMKTMLFAFLTILLINSEVKIRGLVWITVGSLGFFGVKGGIFSATTGGNYLVWGPPGSFIEGNNELGLALVMTIPLMFYLMFTEENKWIKRGLMAAVGLTALAVLTTHSRGAFLAMGGMGGFLWLKSKRKVVVGIAFLIAIPLLLGFMPEAWVERMWSIRSYDEDGSAQGRFNAWWFAYYLALDHPALGGGFGVFLPHLFQIYAPNPDDFHDAHSIYFEVLGEHGFAGLALFLTLGGLSILTAGSTIRMCKTVPELSKLADLNRFIQVSLVGYSIGGAFLGLAYFDLYYHFIAIIVLSRQLARMRLRQMEEGSWPAAGSSTVVEVTAKPSKPKIGDRFRSSSGRAMTSRRAR